MHYNGTEMPFFLWVLLNLYDIAHAGGGMFTEVNYYTTINKNKAYMGLFLRQRAFAQQLEINC